MMNEITELFREFNLFSFLLGCFMTSMLRLAGFSLGVWAKRNREIMYLEGGDMIELLRRMRTTPSPPPPPRPRQKK